MKTFSSLTLALVLVAGFVLVAPAPVDAQCYGICVNEGPGFCLKCRESSTPTGGLCQQVSQCFCQEIQCATTLQSSALKWVRVSELDTALAVRNQSELPAPGTIPCSPETELFGIPTA